MSPVAHAVRLRILACRNDLNRKRIFSVQLTADSSQLIAFIFLTLSTPQWQILHIRLGWRLTFSSLWRLFSNCHSERGQACLVGKTGNGTMNRSEESITLMTSHRFPPPRVQILRIRSGWRLNVLYKDHGASRQKELLAHAVRLRILACRNDLNRKRIVSLQLTAHSW